MTKSPKCDYSAIGLIPMDHFDNDLPFRPDSEIDTSPGSLYDHLVKHVAQKKQDK
jgi:hypothetical protein